MKYKYKLADNVFIKEEKEGMVTNVAGTPGQERYFIDFGNYGAWCPVEYIEPLENRMNTIIFVTHDEDKYPVKRKYIFGIERGVRVDAGDKLYADTRNGKKVVTAVCEPFEVNEHGLKQLSVIYGGFGLLKFITGRAVWGYTEEPFCEEGEK